MHPRVAKFLSDNFRPITAEEAPHLVECAERLMKKAGLEGGVTLHWCDNAHPFFKTMFGAMGGKKMDNTHHIVIGHGIAGALGLENLGHTVTPEMEAVLAHEISHLKHDFGTFGSLNMANSVPLAGLAAGVIALACVRHFHKPKEEQLKDPHHKDLTLLDSHGQMNVPSREEQKTWWGSCITAGKYAAAGVVGLGVGMYASKLIRHRMEFRADKFSADLLEAPEHMRNALIKLRDYFEQLENEALSHIPEDTARRMKKFGEFIKNMIHPPIDQRIDRLRPAPSI